MTTDLSSKTPVEIDTILADLWTRIERATRTVSSAREHVRHQAGQRRSNYGQGPWSGSFDEAVAACEAKATGSYDADGVTRTYRTYEGKALDSLVEAEEALEALEAQVRPFEVEYTRRPWNRYFLVQNVGGHIHRGMNCSTCFDDTRYSWMVDLADCDEAEMVAKYGEMACTVCFPAAPSMYGFGDGRSAIVRYSADERAARAAEKAAKAAAKDAKSITAPDGSPLRVGYDTVRTIIAAERKLSEVAQSFGWYGRTEYADQARQLVEALLARGIPAERVNQIIARANTKTRREAAPHTLQVTA
jgi:hypothetical protein